MKRSLAYIRAIILMATCIPLFAQDTPPASSWTVKELFQRLKQQKLTPTARKAIIAGITLIVLASYTALVARQVKNKIRSDFINTRIPVGSPNLTDTEREFLKEYYKWRDMRGGPGTNAAAEKALNELTNSIWKRRPLADFAFDAFAYPARVVEPKFPW